MIVLTSIDYKFNWSCYHNITNRKCVVNCISANQQYDVELKTCDSAKYYLTHNYRIVSEFDMYYNIMSKFVFATLFIWIIGTALALHHNAMVVYHHILNT